MNGRELQFVTINQNLKLISAKEKVIQILERNLDSVPMYNLESLADELVRELSLEDLKYTL